jgi:hypothetical protein
MADRKAQTTTIGGGAIYAKVAERLKLFREDNPKGKQESAYEVDVDGTIVFTVWLWKNKQELLDLMKAGVTDRDALRSSADANGNAKSSNKIIKEGSTNTKAGEKEFEKLESIALGRALANLGYLASGEIASSEEMEEFEAYQKQQREEAVKDAVASLNAAKTMDDLKKAFVATGMMENALVVAAKDKRKSELSKREATPKPMPDKVLKTPPQKPTQPTETPKGLPDEQAQYALDRYDREHPGVAEASQGLKLDENDEVVPDENN